MLPILNISDYLQNPTGDSGSLFVRELLETCHNQGFFYLLGHGVEPQANEAALAIANRFFDLPLPEREALAISRSPHFRGYTLLEHEMTGGKPDWRDQIDIGPEEAAPDLTAGDPAWMRLRGPNQWPSSLPTMPAIITQWMNSIQPVGLAMVRALAEGLGQERGFFDPQMSPDPYTRVKIIRYPAQPERDGSGQGLGLHHDSGILTFILQDSVPGLQVMSGGQLIDVEPMPGAFVVNLGEMMQSVSNGYLRATKHQVISPPPGKQRISIAYFMNPRLDARFEPVTLPPALAAEATGSQNVDPNDPVFSRFGVNTLKIRMRSHPDVTDAYYADVNLNELD